MLASTALKIAAIIAWHYGNAMPGTAIQTEVVGGLGSPRAYKKFCELIRTKPSKQKDEAKRKYFKEEFLNNPVNTEDCITDIEVVENYRLDTILEILAEVVSN